jgi:hypothetical protein
MILARKKFPEFCRLQATDGFGAGLHLSDEALISSVVTARQSDIGLRARSLNA